MENEEIEVKATFTMRLVQGKGCKDCDLCYAKDCPMDDICGPYHVFKISRIEDAEYSGPGEREDNSWA